MAIQREQVVQTAEKYVSRGKIEPAIREYRKLLAENPNDINTLNRVGDLYARIHRIDEAVDFFTQIAEQYTAEGFFVKAIAIYKKIIKLNPTRLEVYEKLAELYHKQGLINEARTQYQVLADYYQKHENAASAIAIYQKMAELEPENPTYHVKLAEIYHQQQLIEKALGEYRIIAELMIEHGHTQEAAQVYQRGLDIDSENLPFVTDGVLKLKEAGHVALARQLLAVAMDRNPQAERLAQLAGLGDEERAEKRPEAAATSVAVQEPEEIAEPEPPARTLPRWGEEEATVPPVQEAAAPAAKSEPSEEFDLDLDEVFVLEMGDDEEPSSLVKPPADMLGDEPRRPAWAQTPAPAAPARHEPEEPEEVVPAFEMEAEEPAWGAAAWAVEEEVAEPEVAQTAEPAFPEVDVEIEIELEDVAVEAEAEAEPSFDLGETDMLDSLPGFAEFEEASQAQAAPPAPAEPEPSSIFESHSDWALPEVELPEVELETEPETMAPAPAPAPEPAAPSIDPDVLERTAAELHPETLDRDEDLVTEAEVLAKYGLEDKALERLREALRLQPRHLGAHALMIQLHLDKGRHARVVELATAMWGIASTARNPEPWLKTRKRLLAAGYRFDGDRVIGPAQVRPGQEVDHLLRDILGDSPAPKKTTPRPALHEESPPPAAAPMAAAPPQPETEIFAAPPAVASPEPPPAAAPAGKNVLFDPLEIGEMVESEEDDWLDRPAARTRFSVGGAPATPFTPPPVVPSPAPPSPPAAFASAAPAPANPSLDDSLSWLDDTGKRPATAAGAASTAADIFDEESDFFDLAGEIEQELSQEGMFQGSEFLMPSEQSLEEIVEGFKKGVAEHLSPTDYDTHFNLGIAYREMGLLDEAIGEFQLASKSTTHLVSCCSMLGICFLDKGLPELAVKWYRRGLEAPGIGEEDTLGLLYDLGCAYLTTGDTAAAYKAFVDLYGINSNYRDVVARLEELGR